VTYRNRKLLDLAHHDIPCMATFSHQCGGHLGCDPAHSDSQFFGRGFSHKAHDFAFASMCNRSHKMLDEINDRELKFKTWLKAYVRTQEFMWENKLIVVQKKGG